MWRIVGWAACAAVLVLTGCGGGSEPTRRSAPEVGQCRYVAATDLTAPDNDAPVLDCTSPHTAQTYAVGTLPASLVEVTDPGIDLWLYRRCAGGFQKFTGADESRALRSTLTWAWWRPDPDSWDAGDRWFRCDVISALDPLAELPRTTKNALADPTDDTWSVCAVGEALDDSATRVPCSDDHTWRAATTIKLGEPTDPYPGDRKVASMSQQYCSSSISAWLGYPVGYEVGYTWFGASEWKAGNRRAVCWARTQT